LLTTQNTLLEKLVSSSRDDSRTSAAEELANEAKDKDGKGKGKDILSVVKDKKDKDSTSLSDMFGKKSSFGKMFGKKGSFGKMFGGKGKMGGLGGKMGGLGGKMGGMMGKLPMGGLGGMASGAMSSMGGMASAAMGGLGSLGSMASAAAVANPIGAAILGAAALGAGGYMLYDSFRGSDESKKVFDQAEDDGVVEHSVLGDSTILNWEAVKLMDSDSLQALIDYDDWDGKTKSRLEQILSGENTNVAIDEAKKEEQIAVKEREKTNMDVMSRDAEGNTYYGSNTGMTIEQQEQKHRDKGRTVVGKEERTQLKELADIKVKRATKKIVNLENKAQAEEDAYDEQYGFEGVAGLAGEPAMPSMLGSLGGWLSGTSEEGKDESTFAEKAFDYSPWGMLSNTLGLTTSESDKKSQGLDQMNQTALSNKTAGVAQGSGANQQPTNITTDNSVVNNTSITENKSHDADPSAQYLNRRSGSPFSPSFT
jgi:hypothetical protein